MIITFAVSLSVIFTVTTGMDIELKFESALVDTWDIILCLCGFLRRYYRLLLLL